MAIVLGANRYGKAQVRLVHVAKVGETHDLTEFTVGIAVAGDLAATHLTGDNAGVLPTDTMKNTVYAFAREHGPGEPEAFALRLARHFVGTQEQLDSATVTIEQTAWQRLGPHSFRRDASATRTCRVDVLPGGVQVVSGVSGLVLLNSTGSQFHGFVRDAYTTLADAQDRILATEVNASWRHLSDTADWSTSYAAACDGLTSAFVNTYSGSLQQTLMSMGSHVLRTCPEIAEVRLALPNKHHYLVDLAPFGLDNPNAVFVAGDRPYGLIEGTVTRDDAPPALTPWFA